MSDMRHDMLLSLHYRLSKHYGPLGWWPAETPFEVAVGAILTQNTAWRNVEYAIKNLKEASLVSANDIDSIEVKRLEALIRPSGYYRQKTLRLKQFARHLVEFWQGKIENLCKGPLPEARDRLLALSGVGPETADSILLYAANRPSFVIDAYTHRIFQRLGLFTGHESYDKARDLFMKSLPEDVSIYNEYHAQVVNLAKDFCTKRQPRCESCPIRSDCQYDKGTE